MSHPSREELTEFLYEELGPERQQEIALHVKTCGECREQIDQWRCVRSAMASWKIPERSRTMISGQRQHRQRAVLRLAIAASLLVLAGYSLARMTATDAPSLEELRADVATQVQKELSHFASDHLAQQRAFREGVIEHLRRLEAQRIAEYSALRKDIETVALRTQEEFERLAGSNTIETNATRSSKLPAVSESLSSVANAWAVPGIVRAPITSLMLAALPLVLANETAKDEIKLDLSSSGASKMLRGYRPLRLEFDNEKPSGIKKLPNVIAPRYAKLKLGPKEAPTRFYVVLDRSEGQEPRLYVDCNGNGDLTDDLADWEAKHFKGRDGSDSLQYLGGATLRVNYGDEVLPLYVAMYYRGDIGPDNFYYYSDYARTGNVDLGDKTYLAVLHEDAVTGDYSDAGHVAWPVNLILDLNGDGKLDKRREAFSIYKPFNVGGTTYEIVDMRPSGSSFRIIASSEIVPETKPITTLVRGQQAPAFEATTLDGKRVRFPQDFKGKLVLLDFWATWCGPCIAELPHVKAVYEKYNARGLEVVGFSCDPPGSIAKLAQFAEEQKMSWPQVYDNADPRKDIVDSYDAHQIPKAYLVDGDSGVILATGDDLLGEQLLLTVESESNNKNRK